MIFHLELQAMLIKVQILVLKYYFMAWPLQNELKKGLHFSLPLSSCEQHKEALPRMYQIGQEISRAAGMLTFSNSVYIAIEMNIS